MPSVRPCVLIAAACLTFGAVLPASAQVNTATVNAAVADLGSGDRDKIAAARGTLLTTLNAARTNPPALASFAQSLGTGLMPVASGNDPHAKLNAAIVVQRVAEQSGAQELAPVIIKLISDSSPAVSAYGLRAASSVLPRALAGPKFSPDDPMITAIVGAVNAHPDSEAVADETYVAIVKVLNDRTAGEVLTPTGVAAATPRAVEALHKVIAARTAQFGSGALTEPAAELPAVAFLGRQNTFNVSTPAQRTATITVLLRLMEAAADEMSKVPPNTPTTRIRLTDLRNVVKSAGGSLMVIAELAQKPNLRTSAQKAKDLGTATPVNEYRQVISTLSADFQRELPELKAASQPGAATAPATAPAGPPPVK